MSWRSLEDVLKMSWRRLEDDLKTFFQYVLKTSWRRFEDVLKTSWKCLEDVWPRQIYWSWSRRLLKTHKYSKYVCLEDAFWRRRQKTFSRRLHQDECLLGYLLNYSIKANLYIFLVWFLALHNCIFDKLSGEVSGLKLSKNAKAMFIFNTKLFC